jgi:asparagine synthase (glutamine-hydrolysing)
MGGFHLTRDDAGAPARLKAARARFAAHGFHKPTEFALPGWRGFHCGYIHGGPDTFLRRGDDLVAIAGTLLSGDQLGRPALEHLLDRFETPFTGWDRTSGQFAALVVKDGRATVLTDYFGTFQVFHDPGFTSISTSFLAIAEAQPRLTWHDQGVYEFAFNVFPIGDESVFREVRRLGPDIQLELPAQCAPVAHPVAKPLPDRIERLPLAERLERAAAALQSVIEPYARHFGDRMQCPLSGGLDSRLLLGALRSMGVRPHVYVYGEPGDEDVEIALAIGRAEGFEVEAFNKRAYRAITPDEFAEIVARNFDECDALVTDGGLFDNGGNAAARHARQAGGQLAVSGGCGEVFRNFFYLLDRRFTARQVAQAFYARFVRSDTTRRFSPHGFVDAVAAKLAQPLGVQPHHPLSRVLVEQLYPRVRCRAFFGREISLVGRHGAYLMPFLYRRVVEEGLRLPMALKRAGRFEAMLLNRIDPALARHMSAYGHSFAEPPNRDHLLSEWATMLRTPTMRQKSYALRRRLGPVSDEHGGLLSPAFLGRVIDLHFPAMSRFFRPERIADSGLYRRVATLEYLAERLGGRIVGD